MTTHAGVTPAAAVPPAAGAARDRSPNRRRTSWAGLWFVLPFAALYALFLLWPMVSGLLTGFTDRSLGRDATSFVGLDNWAELVADPAVWSSLWNTLVFTALSTPPLVAIGLGMALLTDRARRVGWFLRFSFFAPFLIPVAVVALVWEWMYQPGFGLVNSGLTALGLAEVGWLSDADMVLLSVVITTVWWTVGFNYLLYLAALQGIPAHVYEAAALDGAGPWRRLVSITLPLLGRTTALVVMLQLVASLKIFDQVYLMTDGTGGPDYAARPIIQYIFESGFPSMRIGYASAVSYMFFAVIVIVSIAQFRLFVRKEESR
ncbi:carbohydrate ABC transporter permease [Allonocardiopsis opalescens]|uniref:Carbohydrate ABC transporter membrane protein 1 (CUT1 family) n=1 Tax=Allonocardiopsis opalescens TaxID=1144618 RepID=A0A2T0PX43_9ACTN|nr:sugar ABC transporter permease [Allonocardiopsis opalescens]PRX96107.1 carbohydrate ABC transporter membrane protein 1 (CUT1 family) [Allonocardiopsis opalescens]